MEAFGGVDSSLPDRERVKRGYGQLRQIPADVQTLPAEGSDWLLRRREAETSSLEASHSKSAARLIAGLTAQAHWDQGVDPKRLIEALESIPFEMIQSLADTVIRLQKELRQLIRSGTWRGLQAAE